MAKYGDTFKCETEGCENHDIEVFVDFIPEGEDIPIICGSCGNG